MRIISEEQLKDPKFLQLSKYTLEHNNSLLDREFLKVGDTVCAVIYNQKTKKYIFVKQFRPGTTTEVIELVGGFPTPNLTKSECIKEEVIDETGYLPDSIDLICSLNWVPAYSDEKLHIFYVVVSEKVGNGGGLLHEGEYVEVIEMSKKDVANFDFENLSDAKTIFALSYINLIKHYFTKPSSNIMDHPENRVYGC